MTGRVQCKNNSGLFHVCYPASEPFRRKTDMPFHNFFRVRFALFFCLVLPFSISAAEKSKEKETK